MVVPCKFCENGGRGMAFEPQKFFIGLVDFFSILMPGALLAYLGKDWVQGILFGATTFPLVSVENWAVFLFASYLLGHFAFLIGALLDELLYDPFRKCTYHGQIERLAKGKPLASRALQDLAASHWFFGSNADRAVTVALRIKARALQPISAENAINAYQWCKARLSKEHPEGFVAVQRFEADSKFFRSLVVVLAILIVVLIGPMWRAFSAQQPVLALVCLAGLLLALWRYIDVRFKATQQAYWLVIALEGMKPASTPAAPPAQVSGRPTHAGGVVFQKTGERFEYLLVEGEQNRAEWVLPKGHIEPGEDPRETAVREVKEETGHWARVKNWLADLPFDNGATIVRFYGMELAGDAAENDKRWPAENRRHKWLPVAEATAWAHYPETRALLNKVDASLNASAGKN